MSHPPIQIVDENDEPTGESNTIDAWKQGLTHRISRVMIVSPEGDVLLQKRAKNSRIFPSMWDHSAAGHVDAGESYEEAAKRELFEEIGLKDIPLHEVAYYYTNYKHKDYTLKRFNKVYVGQISKDAVIHIDPEEVDSTKWFSKQELNNLLQNHRDTMTDGLIEVLEKYMNHENH